jgi:hypothetical protein
VADTIYIVTLSLVILNALAIGVGIGFIYFRSNQVRYETILLKKLHETTEKFETVAKAASDSNNSHAKKLMELNDKVTSLIAGKMRISA